MKITSLEIKNYRCFELFTINFPEYREDEYGTQKQLNLHVLLAPNMVGKSAVLKALRIALGARLTKIKANPGPSNVLQIERAEHRVTGESIYADLARDVSIRATGKAKVFWLNKWIDNNYDWIKYKEDYDGKHTKVLYLNSDLSKDANQSFNRVIDKKDGVNPLLLYVGTEYIHQAKARTASLESDGSAKQGYWYCLDDNSMETYVFDWLSRLYANRKEQLEKPDMAAHWGTLPQDTLNAFSHAIKAILPDIHSVNWIERPRSARRVNEPTFYQTAFRLADGNVRSYDMLSDGYRYLVLLVGEIVVRATLLNKHLGETVSGQLTGVVLIDEFGIHLHPDLQAQALKRLSETFPQVQFIVTTHSPMMVSGLYKEQIHMLAQTPEGIRVVQQPQTDVIGLDADRILREIFRLETTYDPLTQGKIDRYRELRTLRSLQKLTEPEWEELSALTDAVSSLAFSPYQDDKLYQQLQQKLYEARKENGKSLQQPEITDAILADLVQEVLKGGAA